MKIQNLAEFVFVLNININILIRNVSFHVHKYHDVLTNGRRLKVICLHLRSPTRCSSIRNLFYININ